MALCQSEWFQSKVQEVVPEVRVVLKKIQTSGDKIVDVPLAKIGGKGLFVKEIEDALLAGGIDFAVHSMKDVPAQLPEGLEILCIPPREDARERMFASIVSVLTYRKTGRAAFLPRRYLRERT